jgi:transcriptional regulator with XRE-family HTH domain
MAGALEPGGQRAGAVVRAARLQNGLTLAALGALTGYSAAQVSRYERGITPLADVVVLRRFARALAIPPSELGLATSAFRTGTGRDQMTAVSGVPSRPAASRVAPEAGGKDDDMRRRQLLAALGAAAAGAAGGRAAAAVPPVVPEGPRVGDLLVSRVRDAMLGLAPVPARVSAGAVRAGLDEALADFRGSRYRRLSVSLPRLISAGHVIAADGETQGSNALLAGIYTLATRMLIKLDDQQLGWMAADRARILASGGGGPLAVGEAARNLAVLARKAGWHDQAAPIALAAASSPLLAGPDPRLAAERGLLIQSAAYTAARGGPRHDARAHRPGGVDRGRARGPGAAARSRRRVHPRHGRTAPGLGGELRGRSKRCSRGSAADHPGEPADDRAPYPVLDRHRPRLRKPGTARRVRLRTAGRRARGTRGDQSGEVAADHRGNELAVCLGGVAVKTGEQRPVPLGDRAAEPAERPGVRVVRRQGGLDADGGDASRGVGMRQGGHAQLRVHAPDTAGGGRLPGDGGGLGVGGALHDDAQVPGRAVAWVIGGGVGTPVGMAEVDAVLDAGDLASVSQPVPAECGVVQAVMGVGADEVQRGRLRRTRGPAGQVAEHSHGGVHPGYAGIPGRDDGTRPRPVRCRGSPLTRCLPRRAPAAAGHGPRAVRNGRP